MVYYYYYYFDYVVIVHWDFFFVPDLLLSLRSKPLFLLLLSVSLSYFILAVPMLEWMGKHLCMSFPFPIAILICASFLPTAQLRVHMRRSRRDSLVG